MTASREPAQVRAILALARPVADEIVLGVDSRVADPVLAACADLVDRPLVYEFDASVERHIAWLHHACRGDWILRLDDDEVPGAGLLGMLGELAADRRRMLFLLPRRHLFPTRDRFLSCHPWSPDYQPRLVRNAPGAWWFAGRSHTAIEVLGERCRLPEAPLYHLHYAQASLAARIQTMARQEQLQPGLRTECFPVNALYVPELWDGVETAAVPPQDRVLVERVARPEPAPHHPVPAAPVVPGREAARLVASRAVPDDAYAAELEISPVRDRLLAGTVAHLEVRAHNLGSEHWPPAHQPEPLIRLAYRWLGGDGETVVVAEGLRTPFDETVRPGEWTVTMLAVQVPDEPGTYVLEVDVVHELVRWFDCPARLGVRVEAVDAATNGPGLARPDAARIRLSG